ncbi:hypothetical protein EB796_020749 [Bugula neritina]|uniref:Uncharacterized protein n=1 Tax=Bugula neritina TaxID=10212 RepID=A0A7J7J5M1_BUGNE|nr:hypothetical protein EB796_020749 [Bugula neritina]
MNLLQSTRGCIVNDCLISIKYRYENSYRADAISSRYTILSTYSHPNPALPDDIVICNQAKSTMSRLVNH